MSAIVDTPLLVSVPLYDADSMEDDMAMIADTVVVVSGDNTNCDDSDSMPSLEAESSATTPMMSSSIEDDEKRDEDGDVVMDEAAVDGKDDDNMYAGLSNLGNTCYMNSAIQMLASLDQLATTLASADDSDSASSPLRQEFLNVLNELRSGDGDAISPSDFKRVMDERSPLFVGYRQQDSHEFVTTLIDLLDQDYQKKKNDDQDEQNTTTPIDDQDTDKSEQQEQLKDDSKTTAQATEDSHMKRITSLSELENDDIQLLLHGKKDAETQSTADNAEHKQQSQQQSPQCKLVGGRAIIQSPETPKQVLQSSNSALPPMPEIDSDAPATNTSSPSDDNSNNESTLPAPCSPVEDYFCTEIRTRLTCDSCKYSRNSTEKYFHLSLDISTGTTIEDGLRKFFAPAPLELKCEKCFGERATQTFCITKLPSAVLFHLKRFLVDVSPDYTRITYRKDSSSVEFPECMDATSLLSEFCATDVQLPKRCTTAEAAGYKIRSVVHHIGSSASCGHYTADAVKNKQWRKFNDSRVTRITPEQALSPTGTAYMVLYELE